MRKFKPKFWRVIFICWVALLLARRRYQQAESFCRAGINFSQETPLFHEWLAKTLWRQARLDEAIQEYRVAMALRKATLSADRMDLIQLLLEAERYEEAIVESQKLLNPQYHRVSTFFKKAHEYAAFKGMYQAYVQLGDFKHAKETLYHLLPFYKKGSKRYTEMLEKISTCEGYSRRSQEEGKGINS